MTVDLKAEIARIAYWKQVAAEHDKQRAVPWNLPRMGASESEISEAERAIGFGFPSDYRAFLALANGWKGFLIDTDLFGTEDFVGGRAREVAENPELQSFLKQIGAASSDVVPIGASDFGLDVFLLFSERSAVLPGGVLWYASEEVERLEAFAAFVSAMVSYNARVAEKLAAQE